MPDTKKVHALFTNYTEEPNFINQRNIGAQNNSLPPLSSTVLKGKSQPCKVLQLPRPSDGGLYGVQLALAKLTL